MAYKIIATILTDNDQATEGLDAAISLADRMGAHLDIYIVTISHTETMSYAMGADALIVAAQTKYAMQERENRGLVKGPDARRDDPLGLSSRDSSGPGPYQFSCPQIAFF